MRTSEKTFWGPDFVLKIVYFFYSYVRSAIFMFWLWND